MLVANLSELTQKPTIRGELGCRSGMHPKINNRTLPELLIGERDQVRIAADDTLAADEICSI